MKIFSSILVLFLILGCKTRSEIKREQEFEQLKQDVQQAKGTKADLDTIQEDMKNDIIRLQNRVEELNNQNTLSVQNLKKENEQLRAEIVELKNRIDSNEKKELERAQLKEKQAREAAQERSKASYENAKKLFEEGQYEEAEKLLKIILKEKSKTDEAKKSHYLLAETFFANHDYATAAIEYGEFKKKYPKDNLVVNCTYRQAQAFKNMNKNSEAKLFYQEVIDSFPRHPLASKAKQELKKMK